MITVASYAKVGDASGGVTGFTGYDGCWNYCLRWKKMIMMMMML